MEQCLEYEIELLRESMIAAASELGLNAIETIECSRRLDNLMNQYDALAGLKKSI